MRSQVLKIMERKMGADKGKNEASPDGKPILGHRQEVTGKKARMKQRKER
jgi:hypothetical protein